MKNKRMPIIISSIIVVVLIIAGAAYTIDKSKNLPNNEAEIQLSDSGIKKVSDIETDGTENERTASTVEIQLDDCAVAVGTVFKAIAIVTPSDTEKSTVWTSSNTEVVEVDAQGIINVKGVGIGVVTATVGVVSDSVVIEGIPNTSSGSANGFGVYVADSSEQGYDDGSWTNSMQPAGGDNYWEEDNAQPDGSANQDNADAYNEPQEEPSGTDGQDGNDGDFNPDNPDDASQNDNTENSSSGGAGDDSSTIGGKLDTQGFSQMLSNVYVYQDGDTYYGEIVTQPNVTIVYIKRRGETFDSQVINVLSNLVPTGYEQVWNNYLTANTDKTFMVDNRKVRIVVAPNGGHSQIVIYN